MNEKNLTKTCILIIHDKIYVGIVMHHQYLKKPLCPCISLSSDSAMAKQESDPLKILSSDWIFSIIAGNKKNYIDSSELEIGQDPTMDCGVSCP